MNALWADVVTVLVAASRRAVSDRAARPDESNAPSASEKQIAAARSLAAAIKESGHDRGPASA